jgi:hypothetical protein
MSYGRAFFHAMSYGRPFQGSLETYQHSNYRILHILVLFKDIGVYLSCFLRFQVVSFLRDLAYTCFFMFFLWYMWEYDHSKTIEVEYMPNPWESWQPEIPRNKRGILQYPLIGYAVIFSENVDKCLIKPPIWHSMEKALPYDIAWKTILVYTNIY